MQDTKLFAFTLDLESDYGSFKRYGIFKDQDRIKDLLLILRSLDIKMTCFVVGEIFQLYPEIVRIFEDFGAEFEVHSYSHNLKRPDSEEEIVNAQLVYFNYFNRYPRGYRAPQGRISSAGIKALERCGFKYDSSIFPSYFPNPLRYLLQKREIHYLKDSHIMEIPFTSVSPFRITLSISYIKLLGITLFKQLLNIFGLPKIICFDSHLHDFIIEEGSIKKLPLFWRIIYSRNKFKGLDYFLDFFNYIKEKGYQTCFMSEVYNLAKTNPNHLCSKSARLVVKPS